MPKHADCHLSPHSPRQLYDLVADVERYPEFLPWVAGAKILTRTPETLEAALLVKFKIFRERYVSLISLHPNTDDWAEHRIDVVMKEGPFTHLTNHWRFEPTSENGTPMTRVHFALDFAFRSPLLENLIGSLFGKAVEKMSTAFEQRATQLYTNV